MVQMWIIRFQVCVEDGYGINEHLIEQAAEMGLIRLLPVIMELLHRLRLLMVIL